MNWTEERIAKDLPKDPLKAAISLCEFIREDWRERNSKKTWREDMVETFALLSIWLEKFDLPILMPLPELPNNYQVVALERIHKWAEAFQEHLENTTRHSYLEKAVQSYKLHLGVGFSYQLTEGDRTRIQELITKLRQQIASSQVLGEDHKRRLLMRLEKLQRELHKRMSDYDRVYGLAIDGIILVQKFGDAVKPITELLREITKLFWISQTRAEELPGDSPLPLPPAPKQPGDR
jgi:hypothetical protein